jgi:hypothetical protein
MTVAAVGVALVCWSVAVDSDIVDDEDDNEDRGPLRPSSSPTLLHRAVLTSVRIDGNDMEKGAPSVNRSPPSTSSAGSTDDEWIYA